MVRRGVTLIETLVYITLAAVLARVIFALINPVESKSQARDGQRTSEINSIDEALSLALEQDHSLYEGDPNVVYVSIPDTAENCPNVSPTLPVLSGGWSYHCALQANLRKVDGTGWIPINLRAVPLVPLTVLPVDPINDAVKGDYYTYVVGWELDANLESKKYALAGNSDRESTDGGDRADLYERGTALNLTPGIIQVAESCVNGTPTYWGQSGADYSDYEVYSDWTIPGNGTVTVTGLRYWQGDGTLSSSEALEMAIYDGNPPYNKISGSAVVHGTGQRGWTSGDLPAPVSIQLGKTYFFGLTSDASSNPRPPVFTDYNDDGNLCPSYLPKPGNMRELVTSNGLDSSVPTPFNIFPPSRSIFGINYIP